VDQGGAHGLSGMARGRPELVVDGDPFADVEAAGD
jgi:hypothetical protein